MKKLTFLCVLFALSIFSAAAQTNSGSAPRKKTVQVKMKDGLALSTDLYFPQENQPSPFPVVLLRNPYNKNAAAALGEAIAAGGYVAVIQDTRGRYESPGDNLPFYADGILKHTDGLDTIEWLKGQSWCDGKIGTWGGSALALTQYLLAATGTDDLSCQFAVVGAASLYSDLVYPGGIFRKSLVEDWLKGAQFGPQALHFWTSHPRYDDFWKQQDLWRRLGKPNAPAVHIGGYYDIFAKGTIDAFLLYQNHGGPKARGQQRLIMGPWTHAVLTEKSGELTFRGAGTPPQRVHDHALWWEHHLKGIPNGTGNLPAVTYYVMGDAFDAAAPGNEWRSASEWPPAPIHPQRFYLNANRRLGTGKPKETERLTYSYDPANPVPTRGGYELSIPAGPMEQGSVESREDVLVFSSDPLIEPLEVIGAAKARLYISSDAPDTDFFVRLCDVYPDGRSYNICEGFLRARFRHSFEEEKLMKPGTIYPLDIELWPTAIVFNKGHRLRIQITSSSAPGFDPNPNTGEPFRNSTRKRVAENTVHMSWKHSSHVILPVVPTKGENLFSRKED